MSTVVIGCKTPNGIIMSALLNGKVVEHRINGWNQSIIDGGHGITHEVPKDLWEAWRVQFKDSQIIKGGFIFAHSEEKSVKSEAKEKSGNKSGQEQLPQVKGGDKEGKLSPVEK